MEIELEEIDPLGQPPTRTIEMPQKITLQLIKLIEEREVLWNKYLPNYRNRHSHEEAWEEISELLGYTAIELKYKWASLRSSYRMYRSRAIKSRLNGSQTVYRTKWFAYEAMSFMALINEKTPYPVSDSTSETPSKSASTKRTNSDDDEIARNISTLTRIAERCAESRDDLSQFGQSLIYQMRSLSPRTIERLKIEIMEKVLEAQKDQYLNNM
ncbi:uncharacterized protein LOC126571407 [Anopheles aquasalis]|uniref:uncharacterized protein LOC126571407 n=1 Tax=Anopheles aquasalis TaxID=42839 RepID=UPI00215B4597|nr:uncharacterized protein LOC126571407 [Anopheles aquasalis]